MELRDKIMSLWSGEVKCQQGCIRGVYYFICKLTELLNQLISIGLVASMSGFHLRGSILFPCRARWIYYVENYIMWETGELIIFHSVVCSVLIVSAERVYLGPAEIMYMSDGPIEIFECIWVNICCILDWIWSQNCRNTLLLHVAGQLVWSKNKIGRFLYIQLEIRHRQDGTISDCES